MPYLQSVIPQFKFYRQLAEKAMAQISDEQLFFQPNDNTNSVAIIMQHLWGNMLSRWTDFRTSDGEKPWRKRDAEFEPLPKSRAELLKEWNAAWDCLFAALDTVAEENLEEIIFIRNEGHTILEAINRQIAHYSYHVGQIVFISKTHCKGQWQSLSIPRNKSDEYNAGKFEQTKTQKHFTAEWLNNGDEN